MEATKQEEELKILEELLEEVRERLGDYKTPQPDQERLTELEEETEGEINEIIQSTNDRRNRS